MYRQQGYRQQGLSLVELMVALVIGLLLSLTAIQIFLSNKTTFEVQSAASRLQENGRFALQYLAAELRPAGVGSGVRLEADRVCVVADSASSSAWLQMSQPLSGVRVSDQTQLGLSGTDQVSALVTDDCEAFLAAGEILKPGLNANLEVTRYCPGMQQNHAVMVLDMEKAVVLRITNRPNSSGSGQVRLVHAAATNNAAANCGGFKFSEIAFTDPARVLGVARKTFFVAETARTSGSGGKVRALFVRNDALVPGETSEIVEGVESMRIRYGLAAANGLAVESYQTADTVQAAGRWADVRTLKIDLLMASNETAPGANQQALQFDGAAVAADGRLRQVFSTVVALRNRIE